MRTQIDSHDLQEQDASPAGEYAGEYKEILRTLLCKYQPANVFERSLVEWLASDVWTSRRMVRLRSRHTRDPHNPAHNTMIDYAESRLAEAAKEYSYNLAMLKKVQKKRTAKAAPPEKMAPRRDRAANVPPAPKRRRKPGPRTTTGEWIH